MNRAWGLAGLTAVCKTVRLGFDSLPCLHFYPPMYRLKLPDDENGKPRKGYTWHSNAWRNPKNHRKLLFFNNKQWVQAGANSNFDVPIHRARMHMKALEIDRDRWRDQAIRARKELSQLKRSK